MAHALEPHRALLEELYLTKDLSLPKVMKYMRDVHSVTVGRTSYERLFNQWGLRKNRKGADWYWVGHRVKQRQNEGRRSALYINKQRIPDHVVRKEVSRHVSALEEVWLGSESAPSSPIGYEIMTPASTASPTASGPTTSISDDIFISQSQLLATAQQKMQPHRYQEPEASQTHNAQICCQNEFQRCDIRDKDMIVTMLEDCSLFITLCARHHNNTFHEQFRELCEALAIEILATLQKSAEYVVPLDKIYFRKEFSILPQSYNGNEEAIRASKATFDTDEYKDIFRAALFLAAAKGILAIVKVLYPVFVNSETGDSKQQTCSYIASINNQPHVVEFLLEKSANVNARSRDGRFPRTIICGPAGREEISQVLIAAGAHLNDKQPEDRMNALYDAAAEGRVECMRAMLRKRAESSYRIPFEWAPLHWAKTLETVHLLVEVGAQVNELLPKGLSPLNTQFKYEAKRRYLIEKGAKMSEELLRSQQQRALLFEIALRPSCFGSDYGKEPSSTFRWSKTPRMKTPLL